MKFTETEIGGVLIIEPRIFEDNRGYFFESYNEKAMLDKGLDLHFVQMNESRSSAGVIRGLHYQLEPRAQAKMVRVLQGIIWDVAVDLRKGSPTYLKWVGAELSGENKKQLLIPKGFAHGFSVLSDFAIVLYKCDEFYAPEFEAGIRFDDESVNVDWKVEPGKRVISERDLNLPVLDQAMINF
jgi:dTDP-4-dehydrorhamnose 3,5-epimerase